MHLKFRRLLSETLERRQLFSADLGYQFDSFDADPWESDVSTSHFQQFMLVRGMKPSSSANFSKGDATDEPGIQYGSSEAGSRDLRSTPRGPRGRMAGESEFAPVGATSPSFNSGVMFNLGTVPSNAQAGKNNSNLGSNAAGQASTGSRVELILVSVNLSKTSNSVGNATNSFNPGSLPHPNTTTITSPSSSSGSIDFKSIPRGGSSGDSRNMSGYIDAVSTAQNNQLARTSLQSASSDILGQSTRLSLTGITSKLNQTIISDNVHRYHQASTDSALIDITGLADNLLSSKLNAAPGRSWKLAEQSIKNLKSLSRTADEIENAAANSDLLMANWMENTNGLIDIACRRDPIARIVRPTDAIEVSARLESKVGFYQVFDLIDDHESQRHNLASNDSVNSKEIVALDNIDWDSSTNVDAPAMKREESTQSLDEPNDPSFRKPFFITSVLAVFGGHLLRSRRKQAALMKTK